MARPGPAPELIVRAWELHCEGRSLRTIAEMLRELYGDTPSHESVRRWIKQGRTAAAWLEEDAEREAYTGPEHVRAKFADALDNLISRGFDEIDRGDATYRDIAPILLRAMVEQTRALGGYAPTRVDVGGIGSVPEVDPSTQKVVDAMKAQAAERERQLLSGEES